MIFSAGQNHGLQYIDDLGNVCHFQTVGIFMEDVETEGGDKSITQCILLVQMSGIVPGSVSHQVPHSSSIRATFF